MQFLEVIVKPHSPSLDVSHLIKMDISVTQSDKYRSIQTGVDSLLKELSLDTGKNRVVSVFYVTSLHASQMEPYFLYNALLLTRTI